MQNLKIYKLWKLLSTLSERKNDKALGQAGYECQWKKHAFVAQLVLEHSTFNGGVMGSSPIGGTNMYS